MKKLWRKELAEQNKAARMRLLEKSTITASWEQRVSHHISKCSAWTTASIV